MKGTCGISSLCQPPAIGAFFNSLRGVSPNGGASKNLGQKGVPFNDRHTLQPSPEKSVRNLRD